ncbi:hypothetical protein IID24_01255 [Patescibacteria group bacterium]|nr:hypothetical protein [Patescibacteria group bacterium]
MTISQNVQYLLREQQRYLDTIRTPQSGAVISVDTVAAKIAFFYEKIRDMVDWREEHLLRKSAIERVLKRRLLLHKSGSGIAEPLLQELIRGGHFPNDTIPVAKIEETQEIVDKYTALIRYHSEKDTSHMLFSDIDEWLLSIAASEIEETLAYPYRERALIEVMTKEMVEAIQIKPSAQQAIQDNEKEYHIYIAVHRALFKLDDPTITYHLIEKMYPEWHNLGIDRISEIGRNLETTRKNIQDILEHPLSERIYGLVEKIDTSYLILRDVIDANPNEFAEFATDSSNIESEIKSAYDSRLRRLQGKIRRAVFYSVISIFITKILVVLLIEVPFDIYAGHDLNYAALGVTTLIPPLFMFIFVSSARLTSESNSRKVLSETMMIIYGTAKKRTYEISEPRKRKAPLQILISTVHLLSFLVSFGAIVWLLQKLNFNALSILIFLLFLSLVAFAGTKIRHRARELLMEERKDGFWNGLFDIFTLPIIQVGRWLSSKVSKYNIVVVALNIIIEIPLQLFIEFIEHWRTFIKEKKEEIH